MNKGKRGIPLSHPHTLSSSPPSSPSSSLPRKEKEEEGKERRGGEEEGKVGGKEGEKEGKGGEGRDVWPLRLIDLDDQDQTGALYFLLRR